MELRTRIALRCLSTGYLVLLTVLLLTPDPMAVFRPERELYGIVSWLMPSAHFLTMALLAWLTLAARWPLPLGWIFGLLVLYAVGTEGLQSLVPTRTPSLADVFQNLIGIATGSAVWVLPALLIRRSIAAE